MRQFSRLEIGLMIVGFFLLVTVLDLIEIIWTMQVPSAPIDKVTFIEGECETVSSTVKDAK